MQKRLPPWIRIKWATDGEFAKVHNLVNDLSLNTVCQDANCPNMHECWNRGTATFMILGEYCTRTCAFCSVKGGKPRAVDMDEPRRVAESVARMGLNYVVVTCVTRDDLLDGGAEVYAETIRRIRDVRPHAPIEVLTSDFAGREESMRIVLDARPDVFAHNLETVKRLQAPIRPMASYGRSLAVLKYAASRIPDVAVKSSLMLGLGETKEEVYETMNDLREAGCQIITLGQYLRPTAKHAEVKSYVAPEEFDDYANYARTLGFAGVASGPMVRSSYKADQLLAATKGCAPQPVSLAEERSWAV